MAKLGQSSFRGILLSGILLISIPVLLIGGSMTYRKARWIFLETARKNIGEQAVRQAEATDKWIQLLESNLISLSQSSILATELSGNAQTVITEIEKQFPPEITCLQLTAWGSNQVIASTCGTQGWMQVPEKFWPGQLPNNTANFPNLYIDLVAPSLAPPSSVNSGSNPNLEQSNPRVPLSLGFSAPIYVGRGNTRQLRAVLTLTSILPLPQNSQAHSFSSYTVLIDENRRILQHLDGRRVGKLIIQESEEDAHQIEMIIRDAVQGKSGVLPLLNFDRNQGEVLAGYAAIPSPLSGENRQRWILLTLISIDDALSGLAEIKQSLIFLILGLIITIVAGGLYLSRYLAAPVEKLRDYALQVNDLDSPEPVPHNFRIQEVDQLAVALNLMVERLQVWTNQLEKASIEAQVANQLKNEFLANVSHELRTPLNGIIGAISIIKDDLCADEKEEQEWLERADGASKHLLNIINDILDIARIESGTLSIFCDTINLNDVLTQAIDLEVLEIQNKGLELIWSESEKPILVYADPDKLQQVFLNILDNAIKFTETGSIMITTEIVSLETDGIKEGINQKPGVTPMQQVRVKIKDTGIGIEPEHQSKLFQPFVMVDGSTTRKYGGNGLGLAISRNILELMAGEIVLESQGLNQGTTITIQLPVYEN